jgi:hypothetical protein
MSRLKIRRVQKHVEIGGFRNMEDTGPFGAG